MGSIILEMCYVAAVLLANYWSFQQTYQITTLMGHSVGFEYPTSVPVVKHHLVLIVLHMLRIGMADLAYYLFLRDDYAGQLWFEQWFAQRYFTKIT